MNPLTCHRSGTTRFLAISNFRVLERHLAVLERHFEGASMRDPNFLERTFFRSREAIQSCLLEVEGRLERF